MKILLADGEPELREGLARLVAAQQDFELIGEASNTREAVEMTRALHPDVALVALDLPGIGGAETARRIRSLSPAVKVILLAPALPDQYLHSPDEPPVGLPVRSERGGGTTGTGLPASGSAVGIAPARHTGGAYPRRKLTPRERAVLDLVAEGWSNRQIQHALGIRESTVKRHVRRIMRKLHVRNRVQAAVCAAQWSLGRREGVRVP